MRRLARKSIMVVALALAGSAVVRMFRGGSAPAFDGDSPVPAPVPVATGPWPPLEPLEE